MLDQRAKKLFVDYISYMIDWYDNGGCRRSLERCDAASYRW